MANPYCQTLGIAVPVLEEVRDHPQANSYALLIVALLERGRPMTLEEVAQRFGEAAVAPASEALLSLRRCRPARRPVYRDGDLYALDPRDEDLDLLVFMLGLRPPRVERASFPREIEPPPGPDVPLTEAELREAWHDASLHSWSLQRVALAVLDALGGPMRSEDVFAFVASLTPHQTWQRGSQRSWSRDAAIRTLGDGRWAPVPGHGAIFSARRAVRERLVVVRRWAGLRSTPEEIQAARQDWERQRVAHEVELARLRRVLVHAFPAEAPVAAALVDVAAREVTTCLGSELAAVRQGLSSYELIGAVQVRRVLRGLGFDPGERRLAELAPPQKTMKLNKRGRTLAITNSLLAWGSCGLSRAFDEARLRAYLREGQAPKLRRRIEAEAKALYALYQYGRLHGAVRLRWGFLDEMIPAPWHHRDEETLYGLKRRALELNVPVELVAGSAPGWSDPWARARRCRVEPDPSGHRPTLVAEDGSFLDERAVQLARLVIGP